MNYKLQKVIKDNKKSMIIIAILWLVMAIVLVAPIAYSVVQANTTGSFNMSTFLEEFFLSISSFSAITQVFGIAYISTFWKTLVYFSIAYILLAIIGMYKSKPKHRYTDIEHGSSDWSENGEQYKLLSKNKGIILAQDNYLPIDKRGNVNVLVVGRFRFW